MKKGSSLREEESGKVPAAKRFRGGDTVNNPTAVTYDRGNQNRKEPSEKRSRIERDSSTGMPTESSRSASDAEQRQGELLRMEANDRLFPSSTNRSFAAANDAGRLALDRAYAATRMHLADRERALREEVESRLDLMTRAVQPDLVHRPSFTPHSHFALDALLLREQQHLDRSSIHMDRASSLPLALNQVVSNSQLPTNVLQSDPVVALTTQLMAQVAPRRSPQITGSTVLAPSQLSMTTPASLHRALLSQAGGRLNQVNLLPTDSYPSSQMEIYGVPSGYSNLASLSQHAVAPRSGVALLDIPQQSRTASAMSTPRLALQLPYGATELPYQPRYHSILQPSSSDSQLPLHLVVHNSPPASLAAPSIYEQLQHAAQRSQQPASLSSLLSSARYSASGATAAPAIATDGTSRAVPNCFSANSLAPAGAAAAASATSSPQTSAVASNKRERASPTVARSVKRLSSGQPNSSKPSTPPAANAKTATAPRVREFSSSSVSAVTLLRGGGRTVPMSVDSDDYTLSNFQKLLRQQILFFETVDADFTAPAQGRTKPIQLSQVGILCKHCRNLAPRFRPKGSVYFPHKLISVYQSAQNMANHHYFTDRNRCSNISPEILQQLETYRSQKAIVYGGGPQYWAEMAAQVGVVETEEDGLKFSPSLSKEPEKGK